ncbi:MAG: HAD-IIB family hydrolase [Hyphomicrobiaceae bacterium]|nr:HAD-IIB family hydrolase [Hyphomicrobiaceae bacterium]
MSIAKLQPLSAFPLSARRGVHAVLTDIDDTLTLAGRLTAGAFVAMDALHRAGIAVVPVTGRPAGWCDQIARQWPVRGVVGENGAFFFSYDPSARRVVRRYWFDTDRRAADRRRLDALRARILAEVPRAAIASDQAYRESDLAIDWCEDVDALSEAEVAHVAALAREVGATVRVSSIHINIWFGEFSKLDMARRFASEMLGISAESEADKFVFVGDSPNDVTMFGYFPHSVGVANVLKFRGRLEAEPTYVTPSEGGDGFAELARAILEVHGALGGVQEFDPCPC